MEKLDFVFLIRDDKSWIQLFSHIYNLQKETHVVDKMAVVAVGTSVLSCFLCTTLSDFKESVAKLVNNGVEFYICINTLHKYGITENMILPEIKIAREGGLIKVARFETKGYHVITLG